MGRSWAGPALGSECFSIQDADQRNACLGAVKADRSYCFKIKIKIKIKGEDLQKDCLANTPR